MDDFARGELLWARRSILSTIKEHDGVIKESPGICFILASGLRTMASVGDCFSEFWELFDGVYPVYSMHDNIVVRRDTPKNANFYFWWPTNCWGDCMRIEAIDFLLTKRQGATYARHPNA